MKRMMIATALATTLATASFALTEQQREQVTSFNSGIDTSTYTERDFTIAYGIVSSGMSNGEKTAKLRALAQEDDGASGSAMISETVMSRLEDYAPDADYTDITQGQAEAALAVTYSGDSRSVITDRVAQILEGSEMDADMMAMVSEGRLNLIRSYAPDADLSNLTEDEVELAVSYAYSGMSNGEKTQQIQELVDG